MKLWKNLAALSLAAAMLLGGCSGKQEAKKDADESAAASGAPMLWKIEGDKDNVMYLFGSIHAGDERNDAVLESLSDKLEKCDALAVEYDLVAYEKDENAQLQDIQRMMYTDGTTVKDHMKPDLYEKAVNYLKDADYYDPLYDDYNLGFWLSLLQQIAVSKTAYNPSEAMDFKLISYAYDNKLEVLEVESASFQRSKLNDLPDELLNLQLQAFFKTKKYYTGTLNELYEAWLNGDGDKLEELNDDTDETLTDAQKKLVADYRKTMYTERNAGMAGKAQEFLKSGKNVFFAVGTAHFLGDDGIIKQLEGMGYTVERIQ